MELAFFAFEVEEDLEAAFVFGALVAEVLVDFTVFAESSAFSVLSDFTVFADLPLLDSADFSALSDATDFLAFAGF